MNIDWKYPESREEWDKYAVCLAELKDELRKHGKRLGIAASSWGVKQPHSSFLYHRRRRGGKAADRKFCFPVRSDFLPEEDWNAERENDWKMWKVVVE